MINASQSSCVRYVSRIAARTLSKDDQSSPMFELVLSLRSEQNEDDVRAVVAHQIGGRNLYDEPLAQYALRKLADYAFGVGSASLMRLPASLWSWRIAPTRGRAAITAGFKPLSLYAC